MKRQVIIISLLLIFSDMIVKAQDLTQGLVSVWEFDETSGTTVFDAHGSNDATKTGALINYAGIVNQAYSFDGNLDYVDVGNPTSLQLTTAISVSVWVNRSANGITEYRRIAQKFYGVSPYQGWDLTIRRNTNGGNVYFFIAKDNVYGAAVSDMAIPTGEWTHIVGTFDGLTIKIYVNGILQTTQGTAVNGLGDAPYNVQIGRNATGATAKDWSGLIDQPAIWNRALTAAEITQLYNNGNGLAYSNWGTTSTPLVAGSISPTSLTVNSGESPGTINGTAASGGTGSYNYQWEKSIDDGANWSVIPGADQESYTPSVLTQSTWYRRKVTSGTETAHSNISEVIVNTGGSSGLWTDHTTHISHNGKVCINTTSNPGDYELMVNGEIRSKEIIVETNWADFVFKPEYNLKSLKEVEQFIKTNGHLPGIPSEAEIKEKGVNVGEINSKLLQKIEELTLHTIKQQKLLEQQQTVNKQLEKRILQLETQSIKKLGNDTKVLTKNSNNVTAIN